MAIDLGARFCVNTPTVTHDVIDGEAVIINLVSGKYYNLCEAGAEIWTLLDRQADVESIVRHLTINYAGDRSAIENATTDLIRDLQHEDLIVPWTGEPDGSPSECDAPVGKNGERPQFKPPVMHKFTDMEELLVLDPIHEVNEVGWPHKKNS